MNEAGAARASAHERARLARSAAFASIAVALLLAGLKAYATWATGSAAMLGSLGDTLLDLVASGALLAGVLVASIPPDANHRFGHGKAEALATMLQVIIIAVAATGITVAAIAQAVRGGRIEAATEGIAVSAIAIAATLALLAWQRFVIARTGSLAIRADHLHYQSDVMLNLAVAGALALDAYVGMSWADPVFGLAIAGWLYRGAWRAGSEAVANLMDQEWPEEKRRAFVEAAASHPELARMHDLRTRTSGSLDFAQFHVDLPGAMRLDSVHHIIERVEADLRARFPDTEILIHVDPEGHLDEPGKPLVEADEFARLGKERQ